MSSMFQGLMNGSGKLNAGVAPYAPGAALYAYMIAKEGIEVGFDIIVI